MREMTQSPVKTLGSLTRFGSGQSGMTLPEVLLAVGLVGILAAASMQIFGDASRNTRTLKDKIDIASVGNYITQFTDCDKTRADSGFAAACASGSSINIRDKRNLVILSSSGTNFADYLTVTNKCVGGQIQLFSSTAKNPTPVSMLANIPIVCPVPPPVCASVTAARLPAPNNETCAVTVTKAPTSGDVSTVLIGGVSSFGTWTGMVWKGQVACPVSTKKLSASLSNGVEASSCGVANLNPAYVTSYYIKPNANDWVKCPFQMQFKVNGGANWYTFSGNRHWSTATVNIPITPGMGFHDGCNVLTPRMFYFRHSTPTCQTYHPPNWAGKGKILNYEGNGTYRIRIDDQYTGADPGISVKIKISPADYKYRIAGYGNGSCS